MKKTGWSNGQPLDLTSEVCLVILGFIGDDVLITSEPKMQKNGRTVGSI